MIDYTQFRELVVVPTLKYLHTCIPFSEESVDLLMMTAAHESKGGTYLKQINGPALGIYQMEPETEEDIWENYLDYRRKIWEKLEKLTGTAILLDRDGEDLIHNLAYATAMARVHYFRVPSPLPERSRFLPEEHAEEEYLRELAMYAKEHYNTHLGKATPEAYYRDFLRWRDS